jgi:hypothetical protein
MLVTFVSLEGTMQVSLVARSSAVFEVSHIGRSFTRLHPELVHPTADQTRELRSTNVTSRIGA